MRKLTYIFADIICVMASVVIAVLLRFDFHIPNAHQLMILNFIPIASVFTVIISQILGGYSQTYGFFGFSELLRQCSTSFLVGCIFWFIKLLELFDVSGSITIIYCGVFIAVSSLLRGFPRFERYLARKTKIDKKPRVIVLGAGKAGAIVVQNLLQSNDLNPVCILDDDIKKHSTSISGVKVCGNIEEIEFFSHKYNAKQIVIAIPSATENEMSEILKHVTKTGIQANVFRDIVSIENYQKGDKKALKPISIEDLLFREAIHVSNGTNKDFISKKVVIVTGGAGSIGSELCRQVLANGCKHLIIFDIHENGLYEINEELKTEFSGKYTTCLGSVRDKSRLDEVFAKYKPEIVFHAAAHKHVPMMEINPFEAVKNNVFGTLNTVLASKKHKSAKFILISTDKAVNPTNVMGATKRICEMIVKTHSDSSTEMVAVRFGNVLGSNGSVIPLFKKQIENGGPVTVTDADMVRYFMTIKEAVSLVLSAGAFAKGSELFVLDMGEPVKIYDLAVNLIKLSGKTPFKDIDIKITGIRDGEKLYEELNLKEENIDKTSHKKIFVISSNNFCKDTVTSDLQKLENLSNFTEQTLKDALFNIINTTIESR